MRSASSSVNLPMSILPSPSTWFSVYFSVSFLVSVHLTLFFLGPACPLARFLTCPYHFITFSLWSSLSLLVRLLNLSRLRVWFWRLVVYHVSAPYRTLALPLFCRPIHFYLHGHETSSCAQSCRTLSAVDNCATKILFRCDLCSSV